VASYLWTKSIAAGALGLAAALLLFGQVAHRATFGLAAPLLALVFILLTAGLLVWDLKRPERFWYLLVKPNPRSWLVWGGYVLPLYGLLAFLWLAAGLLASVPDIVLVLGLLLAIAAAGYTAFLFGQAEGRDFWQSPLLLPQLLAQATVAGAGALSIAGVALGAPGGELRVLGLTLAAGLVVLVLLVAGELFLPHVNAHVHKTVRLLTHGPYRAHLLALGLGLGVVVPLAALTFSWAGQAVEAWNVVAALAALAGLWSYERIWISAGQDVPLS
jgi:formate-dependent nitrite reductase membrane component NrfD